MIYEVRDPLLAQGWLRIEVLTAGQGAGLMLQLRRTIFHPPPRLPGPSAASADGKGARNGDIGCEVEPARASSRCARKNAPITFTPSRWRPLRHASCTAPPGDLRLRFPAGSHLGLADASTWDAP